EWLMFIPNDGRLPHTSHTAAIGTTPRHLGPPGVARPAAGPTGHISIPGMQTLERLTAGDLAAAVASFRDALRTHQERINRLNVYPVPDGDTGTNMALTLEAVVRQLADQSAADMAGVAEAISYGSLMGARGNSGVILSQILRGLADAVRDTDGVDGDVLREALTRAADGADQAVQNPVEGTILTVCRAAANAATTLPAGAGLVPVLEAARNAARDALANTPELLPVLKAAGVVD